ncbi:MAG TPA: AAA family ATPase [Planctomicrobium sp.]|nr:AAA family ATPase [Planctomicrobium sp.]
MQDYLKRVIHRYHQEGIVFQSAARRNAISFTVTGIDDEGCDARRLDNQESSHFLFSDLFSRISAVEQHGGTLPLQELGETTAFQTLCLQSVGCGISRNRKNVLDLSSEEVALEHFQELLLNLNVNKSGSVPTLYKPVIVWCVLNGVLMGELTENQIPFDWIVPRFQEKCRSLSLTSVKGNAVEAFFHLTGDLFWMLAYRDPLQYFETTPNFSDLQERVKYATIKETYWRLLANSSSVKALLSALESHWFQSLTTAQQATEFKINLRILDLAVERTIRPFLIDDGKLDDENSEGYLRKKLLPRVQPLLSSKALTTDPKGNVEAALKGNLHLLSQYDQMPGITFIRSADSTELQDQLLALLYGDAPLLSRLERFGDWAKVQKTSSGEKSGFNATAIGYFLGLAEPEKYAFCKPTPYTAAVKALVDGPNVGNVSPIERLDQATRFYQAALKLFRERYQLPFKDLLDVHTAFYIMNDTYHGLPGWNDLMDTEHHVTERLELNAILYGPPGTGKTYTTMHRAVTICDGVAPPDRSELMARFKQLRDENRISFITFHQSYSYEDFVEGIRPVIPDEESTDSEESRTGVGVRYECRPGLFKQICMLAKARTTRKREAAELDLGNVTVWKMSLGNTLDPDESGIYDECIENNYLLLGYGRGLDFTGCQSRHEIFERLKEDDPEIKVHDFQVQSVDVFKNRMKVGDLVVISDGNRKFRAIARITGEYQFSERESYEQLRPVEWLVVFDESLPREKIYDKIFSQMTVYRLRHQDLKIDALKELIQPSAKTPGNYVLIIDEINRGNIAKILGELITLLEPDKRLGQTNELQVTLPYSGETFGIPSNLHLIGTMNTADRSIAFLDVALRRRFSFVEMMPELDVIRKLVGDEGVVDGVDIPLLLETINDRIELLYDRDHQIGHAFFLNVQTLKDLREVFCGKVIPLLSEYFYGDWNKICLVLGCPFGDPGDSIRQRPHPIVHAKSLGSSRLLNGCGDLIEDKVRCEIDQTFRETSSSEVLRNYFLGITSAPEGA